MASDRDTPQTEAGKCLLVKYGLPVEADAEVAQIEREARAEPDAGALRAEIARLERQLQKCEEGPWG